MAQLAISYGATQPPIIDQLNDQGHTIDDPNKWEGLREAILRLAFAGVLTDAMTTKSLQRLHNNVMKYSREIETDDKKAS
jgi:hypothetical protein